MKQPDHSDDTAHEFYVPAEVCAVCGFSQPPSGDAPVSDQQDRLAALPLSRDESSGMLHDLRVAGWSDEFIARVEATIEAAGVTAPPAEPRAPVLDAEALYRALLAVENHGAPIVPTDYLAIAAAYSAEAER